ncbi:MAG: hypothetical protein GWN99_03055 [Gemmatimonadetes bacterium]|uniref:Tetratricopeptide repeat protein n=1 Tax=Candidatus Kutchimonas denitrificans TaxID=3056748 RepID=A0AAE4ZC93_9BACT|nr:hypothetical protein [Gemmatimonadota bacterium]NIR74935.1 hypothetical protein [Candidatus Kutchimonas denitrificans]NIS00047.1 hypothetical protein [Gemmatimonadota bacterium]NIT65630.1 hypothetical protein [Gemmatimonadota bacterium]NIU52600.1 hypothetical protein [Gemmatimonadota bacterium]
MVRLPNVSAFIAEVKRRGVFRAAAMYAAAAWVVIEASATILPALNLAGWTVTAVVVLAMAGLPVALLLAWAFELTPQGVRRAAHPSEPAVADPPSKVSRARGLAAVLVVAVLAAIGGYLTGKRIARPALGEDGRVGLAVFPFRQTGAAVEGWSEGLADLLATALDGTQGIRVTDPWSLWRDLRPEPSGRARAPSPEEADRLALTAGAHHFLLGSIVGSGESLNVNVRVYAVGEREPIDAFVYPGAEHRLSDIVQRLAVETIRRVWPREDRPNVPELDRYATHSADALKAYLDAKAAMRRGQVDSANAAIDRALAADSTFALALLEAARIKSWAQYMKGEFFTGLQELAEKAVEHSDSLSERNRLRAKAMLASIRTDGAAAAEATHRIIEIDSTDFAAWDDLSYYHLVYGWQYGAGPSDALAAAERLVRLDSTYVPGLARRASLSASLGDADDIRLQIARLRAADTTNVLIRGSLLGLRAVLADDSVFAETEIEAATAPPRVWITVLRDLRRIHPDRAESLLRRLQEIASPGRPQWTAEAEHARLLLAEGRTGEVYSAIESGEYRVWELWKHLHRFNVAATLVGVSDSAAARKSAQWLAEYIPPDSALAYFETRPVWWTGWLVGAYHAAFGDSMVTREWQRVIGTLPEGGTPLDYRGALQRDLEARLAVRRGDLTEGLAQAKRAFDLWSIHTENDWEAAVSPQMRFHLALLYEANDQPDSAEALYASLVPPTTWMGFLTTRAAFELGELAEARGDHAAAARHYRLALSYWDRGGPEVASWRERAMAGLEWALGEGQR